MKQFHVNWFNIFEAELHFLRFYFGVNNLNALVLVFTSDGLPCLGPLHIPRNKSKNAVRPSRNLYYDVPCCWSVLEIPEKIAWSVEKASMAT